MLADPHVACSLLERDLRTHVLLDQVVSVRSWRLVEVGRPATTHHVVARLDTQLPCAPHPFAVRCRVRADERIHTTGPDTLTQNPGKRTLDDAVVVDTGTGRVDQLELGACLVDRGHQLGDACVALRSGQPVAFDPVGDHLRFEQRQVAGVVRLPSGGFGHNLVEEFAHPIRFGTDPIDNRLSIKVIHFLYHIGNIIEVGACGVAHMLGVAGLRLQTGTDPRKIRRAHLCGDLLDEHVVGCFHFACADDPVDPIEVHLDGLHVGQLGVAGAVACCFGKHVGGQPVAGTDP